MFCALANIVNIFPSFVVLGVARTILLVVLVHDRVASLVVCLLFQLFFFFLFFNIKYKSFLAGVELNFGIANRITGFRIFFF